MNITRTSSSQRVTPVTPVEPGRFNPDGKTYMTEELWAEARRKAAPTPAAQSPSGAASEQTTQQFLRLHEIGQERQKRLLAARPGQAVDMYLAILTL
jgi:hypothetical protein